MTFCSRYTTLFYHICIWMVFILMGCSSDNQSVKKLVIQQETSSYLNHSDSARYVGMNTCKLCHQSIYETFIKTGMGQSFDKATKQKSSADYHQSVIQDKIGDFYYKAFWLYDSLQILEYRLQGRDTIYKRQETVDFIVGSGQHTNSHIQSVNGYLNQMPMTFYTQKKKWDLPPGFENGHNSRFLRKIGLECMSCHNSYPEFVLGSENKYASIPEGINCERCHGPGSIHVAQRQTGSKVDTSKYIDYSIVNPAKLTIDAQFDICQRCHLQGNTVLKEGKSFYDFKPGMKLSDYMTVFLPKYKDADDEFIMASHADRLKQSRCFIQSLKKSQNTKSLKPYQNALTCVTCHNPHVSVRETNPNIFNDACNQCHEPHSLNNKKNLSSLMCSNSVVIKQIKNKQPVNCVSCHMPKSGSIDIPHVTVHDHYIRKPVTQKDKQALKKFIGLYAINEKNPDGKLKAKAYLNQYEKFENQSYYLDSAFYYLKDKTEAELKLNFELLIQLYFIKNDFNKLIFYVNKLSDSFILQQFLIKKTYSNEHAWTCYRIGEAFYNLGNIQRAATYYKQAVNLAPFVLDFKHKYGLVLASQGLLAEAEKTFEEIRKEHPKHVSALTNLGYIQLSKGKIKVAEELYFQALSIDPDYEPLLLNLAGLHAYKKEYKRAQFYLNKLLKRNPNHSQAKQALQHIKQFV